MLKIKILFVNDQTIVRSVDKATTFYDFVMNIEKEVGCKIKSMRVLK